MKEQFVLIIIGLIVAKLTKKHHTADCICGEVLGIAFIIAISFILCEFYDMIHIEPSKIARVLLLGYLPGRVINWAKRRCTAKRKMDRDSEVYNGHPD